MSPTPSLTAITPYHAKYFAYDLTRRSPGGMDRLTMSLFDAAVDLNPHQIEAALFALQSPLSKGVILADEVGLGKTIEAGIVLCQLWAERKRRLLVICPASLRKQWALELHDKFNLPAVVLDAKAVREARRAGRDPLLQGAVLVMSFHFASAFRDDLKAVGWDLVVIDEAHKLRNAYLLRNLSRGRGVGFFEAGNFYPDFILWQVEGPKQFVSFVDPKGIRNLTPDDPKIQFRETIKEIEDRLGDPDVVLSSFIVSNTPAFRIEMQWGLDRSELDGLNILFQEEDRDTYVGTLLSRAKQ